MRLIARLNGKHEEWSSAEMEEVRDCVPGHWVGGDNRAQFVANKQATANFQTAFRDAAHAATDGSVLPEMLRIPATRDNGSSAGVDVKM